MYGRKLAGKLILGGQGGAPAPRAPRWIRPCYIVVCWFVSLSVCLFDFSQRCVYSSMDSSHSKLLVLIVADFAVKGFVVQ